MERRLLEVEGRGAALVEAGGRSEWVEVEVESQTLEVRRWSIWLVQAGGQKVRV